MKIVGGRNPRIVSRQILAEIIEPRMEEIFGLVRQEIVRQGLEDVVAAGIVLTGGSSLLEGCCELAEQVFHLPTRKGIPQGVGGLVDVVKSPMYSTCVGLVQMGFRQRGEGHFRTREANIYHKVKGRMREWLSDIF